MTENMSDPVPGGAAPVELDTGRMLLRSLAASDATLYCDLYTDAEIMRFIGAPLSRPRALSSFRKALQLTRCRPFERLFLAVVEKTTQQAVGLCSIELQGKQAETGIILCAKSRARGRAREALGGTVALAFAILPLDAVCVRISAGHRVAERLVMGLGFSRGAEATGRDTSDGGRVWSIDRHAWDHAQRALPVSKHLHGQHRST
jgi:RimJ/RimL family protein N-acetyltransferase